MLKINPFYLILFFYISINFIFFIIGSISNNVEIEFNFFKISSYSFFIAFLLQAFVCFLIFIIYIFFDKKNRKNREVFISNNVAYFLITLQLIFLFYNLIYGVNIAGSVDKSDNKILNLILIILPADIFFILLSPYIKSNKLFLLSLSIYVISNTLRGWMGGVFFGLFVAFCRSEYIFITYRNFLKYLTIFLLIISILPYLMQIKWVVRSGGDVFSAINFVNENGYVKLLSDSLFYTFNRFQHNYHVALVWENYENLNLKYNNGWILPYWQEGIIQYSFSTILGVDHRQTLGAEMAREFFGSRDSWSANPGLAGWLIVLQEKFILLILYVLFILFLSFYWAVKYHDRKILLILAVFSIFYLFHGWIGMYITLVTYFILFTLLKKSKL